MHGEGIAAPNLGHNKRSPGPATAWISRFQVLMMRYLADGTNMISRGQRDCGTGQPRELGHRPLAVARMQSRALRARLAATPTAHALPRCAWSAACRVRTEPYEVSARIKWWWAPAIVQQWQGSGHAAHTDQANSSALGDADGLPRPDPASLAVARIGERGSV
jgi:hypothetical protein